MTASETTYRRSPAVEETIVGDRVVLYHRLNGAAIVLNPTASILWTKLSSEREPGELEQALLDRFPGVERHRIETDVRSCLVDLENHNLISTLRNASSTAE